MKLIIQLSCHFFPHPHIKKLALKRSKVTVYNSTIDCSTHRYCYALERLESRQHSAFQHFPSKMAEEGEGEGVIITPEVLQAKIR